MRPAATHDRPRSRTHYDRSPVIKTELRSERRDVAPGNASVPVSLAF
jgi:hypothetical protein